MCVCVGSGVLGGVDVGRWLPGVPALVVGIDVGRWRSRVPALAPRPGFAVHRECVEVPVCGVPAVSEPSPLTGTTFKFIDTPWVGTHASTPEADISSDIVSVGKGPQENLVRDSEIRTGAGADGGGGMELLALRGDAGGTEGGNERDKGEALAHTFPHVT